MASPLALSLTFSPQRDNKKHRGLGLKNIQLFLVPLFIEFKIIEFFYMQVKSEGCLFQKRSNESREAGCLPFCL